MGQPKKLSFKEKQEKKLQDELKSQIEQLKFLFKELKTLEKNNSEAVIDAAHVVRMESLKISATYREKSQKIHQYGINIATYAQNIINSDFSL